MSAELIGPYVPERVLGTGTTGKVKLARHRDTNQQVAIKIIPKSAFAQKPNLQMKVRREIALMRVVNHPNIIRQIDVLESPGHLHIVLEYAERGELFDYLIARRYLPEFLALDFFRQITLGLEYLHSHGICHRDLKPENILLDSNNRIKIADFGFARWIRRDIAETSCGSPHYAAPEVIRGIQYDGRRADIWSLGVILYALLAGYLPFDDPSMRNLLHKVKRGAFEMPAFPADIQNLIRAMITVDPVQRITIEDIKKSAPFLRNLEPEYFLPSPIPFTHYSRPVDPAGVTEDILVVLRQIGYTNEEELRNDLQATTVTMAKVFVAMLTAQLDLETLPWEEQAANCSDSILNQESLLALTGIIDPGPNPLDPFRRHMQMTSPPSTKVSSVASRVDWYVEATLSASYWITEEHIQLTGWSAWDVMYQAQVAVGDCGLQYFHPDPLTMYVRKSDRLFYVSVIVEFVAKETLDVKILLHKGMTEQFKDFRDRLWQLFRSHPDKVEDDESDQD
jgi:BR serine/threonine kinase